VLELADRIDVGARVAFEFGTVVHERRILHASHNVYLIQELKVQHFARDFIDLFVLAHFTVF